MSGHIVETVQEPSWKSVEEYEQHVKRNVPVTVERQDLLEADTHCVCCGQECPHSTAALLKVEERTPTTIDLQKKQGRQLWLCADCYFNGVRPKYVEYGDVAWNKQGRRIKARAERHGECPW